MHTLRITFVFIVLCSPTPTFARKLAGPENNYDESTQLFNGWTQNEIHQMPQDAFGDTGPVINQFDGIDSDPNWINENE